MSHLDRRKMIVDKIRISLQKCLDRNLEVDEEQLILLITSEFNASRAKSREYLQVAKGQLKFYKNDTERLSEKQLNKALNDAVQREVKK